jgi:hypothetical protein
MPSTWGALSPQRAIAHCSQQLFDNLTVLRAGFATRERFPFSPRALRLLRLVREFAKRKSRSRFRSRFSRKVSRNVASKALGERPMAETFAPR